MEYKKEKVLVQRTQHHFGSFCIYSPVQSTLQEGRLLGGISSDTHRLGISALDVGVFGRHDDAVKCCRF